MSTSKKYYWLKLKENFFDEKYIKALRKLPDGDALTIVYLKMQLKSLQTEGVIKYDHILPSAEEELALVLDEDVNIVRLTLTAIINMGLVEKWENDTLYMVALQDLIGSETSVAERVRNHRKKQKALQCNTSVTNCNTEIEKEIELDIEKEIKLNQKKETTTNIYTFVEDNFGRLLTSTEVKKIQSWLLSFDEQVIKYAFEKSVLAGVRTFRYVEGTLNNWKGCNYKTIQDIKDNEKNRNRSNQLKGEGGAFELC